MRNESHQGKRIMLNTEQKTPKIKLNNVQKVSTFCSKLSMG